MSYLRAMTAESSGIRSPDANRRSVAAVRLGLVIVRSGGRPLDPEGVSKVPGSAGRCVPKGVGWELALRHA